MNKERRKQIATAVELLEQAAVILEECYEAEQEYYDNMPESLQQGDKGQTAEDAAIALSEAKDACEAAVEQAQAASGGGW